MHVHEGVIKDKKFHCHLCDGRFTASKHLKEHIFTKVKKITNVTLVANHLLKQAIWKNIFHTIHEKAINMELLYVAKNEQIRKFLKSLKE